ncbi:DUF5677 domain-containing protein [Aerococcus tenax]|uniref:DUF5677 domain-containing protein n=1 Tax=Aerococcus tenax TaxID=3078812 RepID=UPI0018A6D645|nr:DUF5677 domain-containing protein [Aerococcus tenax]
MLNAVESIFKYSIKNNKGKVDPDINIAIISLFSSLMEKVYDIKLLCENKRYDNLGIILRSFFEQSVYLRYILKEDTLRRSKAFIYGHYIDTLKKLKRLLRYMNQDGEYFNEEEYECVRKIFDHSASLLEADVSNSEELLEKYQKIYKEQLINMSKKFTFNNFKWYNLTGKINNFRKLTNVVGMVDADYDYFYSLTSSGVHGTDPLNRGINMITNTLKNQLDPTKDLQSSIFRLLKETVRDLAKHYNVYKSTYVQNMIAQYHMSYRLSKF